MCASRRLKAVNICIGLVLYGAYLFSTCSDAYVFDYSSWSGMISPPDTAHVGCYPPDVVALHSLASSFSAFQAWGWPATILHDAGVDEVVYCCSWPGVTCSSTSNTTARRVSGLDLRFAHNASFRGSLDRPAASASLCSLSALSHFTLCHAGNRLTGGIPLCIGTHLTSLQHLGLAGNSLAGPIPISFSNLHSLQYLSLAYNKLSGSIPSFISSPHLRLLDLSHNFFSGTIPTFNAPHLHTLLLSENHLSGSLCPLLHSSFPKLTELQLHLNSLSGDLSHFTSSAFPSLQHLRLGNNLLTGHFPLSLCCLTTLVSLHINSNQLSGPLPSCGESFPELRVLDLSSNQLTGPFPANWSSLQAVDLSYNRFNGTLPWFSHVVDDIRVCHNEFSGPFPASIGDALGLSGLDLSFNKFSGRIPPKWQKLTSLTQLALSGNSLFDPLSEDPLLPRWLFELPNLILLSLGSMGLQSPDLAMYCDTCLNRSRAFETLDLSYNNLSANILRCFNDGAEGRCLSAAPLILNLAGNPLELNLSAPDSIARVPRSGFGSLDLSSCGLKGHLTDSFFKQLSPSLSYLSLAHNALSGEIRVQIPSSSYLAVLDLSHNAFTRMARFSARPYTVFHELILSNNKIAQDLASILQGIIVDVACNITFNDQISYVASLDLSNNQITGSIPASLRQFEFLSSLKVDNNLVEGTLLSELFEGKCFNLKTLSLSNNNLEGPIPASLGGLKELLYLNLSSNKFSGSIPPEIGNLTLLQSLDLSFNKLQGPIPAGIADLTKLVYFNISNNADLSAHIPDLINRPVPFAGPEGARILERPW